MNIEAMLAAEAQRWRDAAHAMFCNAEPFAIFAEAKAKNVIGAGSGAGLESEFRQVLVGVAGFAIVSLRH